MSAPLSATAKNLQIVFKKHDITVPLNDRMLEQFATFYKFLMEYNKKYNLTRLTTFEEVAVKHFVDCIYVAQTLALPGFAAKPGALLPSPLIDMGSGAGFPGVPLKIISPDTRVILVEGVQKKVEYLKQLRDKLELKGLDIIGRNVEPKMVYPAQGLITRAVETCTATLKNAVNCVLPNGHVILMKTPGVENEVKEAQNEMSELYELEQDKDYRLGPTSHERKLVAFMRRKSNK